MTSTVEAHILTDCMELRIHDITRWMYIGITVDRMVKSLCSCEAVLSCIVMEFVKVSKALL